MSDTARQYPSLPCGIIEGKRVAPRGVNLRGRGHHRMDGDCMDKSTTPPRRPSIRVNLLRAHGSPTCYLYAKHHGGCRCAPCVGARRDAGRRYRKAYPDRCAEYLRSYTERTRDHQAEYNRRYYAAHRAGNTERHRLYCEANSERMREYRRLYREANSEGIAESKRRYRMADPERERVLWRSRRALTLNAPGSHTAADVKAQYAGQRGLCFYCDAKVGRTYHVDHVVPLALGGSNGPENLVIACPLCNLSKCAKHPMDFAGVMF